MADSADRVVVELLANVDGAEANVKRYSKTFEDGADRAAVAATKVEGSTKLARFAARDFGFQLSDIGTQLGSGQSPFIVLVQQGPQVVDALQLMTAAGATLGTTLKTIALPGFIAIASILGTLIPAILRMGDAQEKTKGSTRSLEDAIKDLNTASVKEIQTSEQSAQAKMNETRANLASELSKRNETKAKLDAAKAELAIREQMIVQPGGAPEVAAAASIMASTARSGVKALQTLYDKQTEAALQAQDTLRNLDLPGLQEKVRRATDASAASTGRYQDALTALNKQRQFGMVGDDEYVQKLTQITLAHKAEIQAISDGRKADSAAEAERKRNIREQLADLERLAKAVRNTPLDIEMASDKLTPKKLDINVTTDFKDTQRQLKEQEKADQQAADNRFAAERQVDKDLQRERQADVRSLASLYLDLFTGGTKAFVKDFERLMLQALAEIAAKKTVALFGGKALSALSGLFGNSTKSATPEFGRASGGYVGAGQLVRINESASPGRVEGFRPTGSGTIIPLGQMDQAAGGGTSVFQTLRFDLNGAVLTSDLLAQMNAMAETAAVRGAAGGSSMAQGALARRQKYRLGR